MKESPTSVDSQWQKSASNSRTVIYLGFTIVFRKAGQEELIEWMAIFLSFFKTDLKGFLGGVYEAKMKGEEKAPFHTSYSGEDQNHSTVKWMLAKTICKNWPQE